MNRDFVRCLNRQIIETLRQMLELENRWTYRYIAGHMYKYRQACRQTCTLFLVSLIEPAVRSWYI